MKYIVKYGDRNWIESNSRNARKHLQDLGGDSVRVETKSGKLVCVATLYADGSVTVTTTF